MLPAGVLGDIMLSWPLRIAGVTLAIAQLLHLAVSTLGLRLDETLSSHLNLVNGLLSRGLHLDIVAPFTRNHLGSMGVIMQPGDHWLQLFILLWLVMVAGARNAKLPPFLLMSILCAPVALATALVASSLPVTSKAFLLWTVAGLLASLAVNGAIVIRTWSAFAIPALACGIAIAGGIMQPGPLTTILGYDPGLASTPLLILASCAAITAALLIAMDVAARDGTLWERLNDPGAATGVDIMAALAGAATLAHALAA